MKEVPNRLKCEYCMRNQTHGGECSTISNPGEEKGCLLYKPDERGCIRTSEFRIFFPLYTEIPSLNGWTDYWQVNGVNTEIKVTWIKGLYWDSEKGYLIVYCRCDYYINKYHEDYKETKDEPVLKLVR